MATNDLQDLYFHLDHTTDGNTYLAWYAQRRAIGESHREAIEHTLTRFRIREKDWYKARLARRGRTRHGVSS